MIKFANFYEFKEKITNFHYLHWSAKSQVNIYVRR